MYRTRAIENLSRLRLVTPRSPLSIYLSTSTHNHDRHSELLLVAPTKRAPKQGTRNLKKLDLGVDSDDVGRKP